MHYVDDFLKFTAQTIELCYRNPEKRLSIEYLSDLLHIFGQTTELQNSLVEIVVICYFVALTVDINQLNYLYKIVIIIKFKNKITFKSFKGANYI